MLFRSIASNEQKQIKIQDKVSLTKDNQEQLIKTQDNSTTILQNERKQEPIISKKNQYKHSYTDIVITSSGKISETCGAVKSGAVRFTQDGKIDKRCSAVRNGYLFLTKQGQIDHRCQAYQNQQHQLTLTISQEMLNNVIKKLGNICEQQQLQDKQENINEQNSRTCKLQTQSQTSNQMQTYKNRESRI